MDSREPDASRACKYVVAQQMDRWRVTHDDASIGTFEDAGDAARFACDAARLEAQAGVPAVVVVQAPVMEMHCFTPPVAARAAPHARLRLVGGVG